MSEANSRNYEWGAPELLAEGSRGLTGLQFMQKIVDGSLPQASMSATLRFRLVAVAEGFARFVGLPSVEQSNPMGGVHGGWASTLLDSAMGCAVLSMLDEKSLFTTLQLSVYLTRPINAQTGLVQCEGKLLQLGKRVALAEGKVTCQRGALLAHASTSCLIIPRPD